MVPRASRRSQVARWGIVHGAPPAARQYGGGVAASPDQLPDQSPHRLLDDLLADLEALVSVESPSRDLAALTRSAEAVADLLERRLGAPAELVESPAGPHVHWRSSSERASPRVLLLGHHDTVFPIGTLASRPFRVADGRATGPGVFDMKGGIVQAVHAVAALDDPSGVELLLSADEEVGSGASRELIEARASACGAVLVLEPSADGGALKTARKGTGTFEIVVHGRAAHAGLEPERGVNALLEAARQSLAIADLAAPALGTTVTPTVVRAGTTDNVVPATAVITVDVRVVEPAERDRIETAMASLVPVDPAATIEVRGGIGRPPMPSSASASLFPLAQAIDPSTRGVAVGGGSDGNFTAAIGVPTLDGLGAVGGGAHADDEWIDVAALAPRTAFLTALIRAVTAR
jgi:glutamate carboxypeptidase